jgi:hypothetical protein
MIGWSWHSDSTSRTEASPRTNTPRPSSSWPQPVRELLRGAHQHVALESNGEIQVFDIWESQEAFDAFGPTLMPILAGLDVTLNEPMVGLVHNVIQG